MIRPAPRLGAALLALALAPACRADPPAPPVGAAAAASGPGAAASSQAPSARLGDARWRRAAEGDPLDLARLAADEGAVGLLEALEDGGAVEETALRALPYADDADLALGPLAERALAAPPGAAAKLLRPLSEIAGEPPRPREPLDPEGARAAAAAALALARRAALPAPARALAITAARGFARRGLLDPAEIPEDPR